MYDTTLTRVYYNIPIINPSVYISVKGNRIKTYYENNEIRAYLKDGTEFQLEFHNDSNCYVKAEIVINGKSQVNALVLKPYQRFFLDRFMDEKKKFKFNTFLTGNDNIEELKEIIANNGKIEVKFYKEFVPISSTPPIAYNYNVTNMQYPFTPTISSGDSIRYTSTTYNEDTFDSTVVNLNPAQCTLKKELKEIETGRIESGKTSSQRFVPIEKQWESFTCAVFNYHIMPESQRPSMSMKSNNQKNVIKADDIRTYCSKCGRRIKKGYNFCPGCGERF